MKHDLKLEIGKRIKLARGKEKQSELARKLGIARSSLSDYERGKIFPPHEVLLKISQIYGKPIDWFFKGEEAISYSDEEQKWIQEQRRIPLEIREQVENYRKFLLQKFRPPKENDGQSGQKS